MLQESLIYFSNSFRCPKYVKKIGLLGDLIAIDARYGRHKKSWQEHLQKTKATILAEAMKLKHRNKILILGAGSLNDVPLAELSTMFKEVHLLDIFFLNSTVNKVKACNNVKLHEIDVTDSLKALYEQYTEVTNNKETFVALDFQVKSPCILLQENFDMVVSLNLLSQLPLAAKKFFDRKNIGSHDFDDLYQLLITKHLDYLQKFVTQGSKVLLITDIEKQIYEENREITVENTLQDIDFSKFVDKPIDTWIWKLAPRGELGGDFELCLKVNVYNLNSSLENHHSHLIS